MVIPFGILISENYVEGVMLGLQVLLKSERSLGDAWDRRGRSESGDG